jgi:hypothetical protein
MQGRGRCQKDGRSPLDVKAPRAIEKCINSSESDREVRMQGQSAPVTRAVPLYTFLQILSIMVLEKTPLDQLLTEMDDHESTAGGRNQLLLFSL